MPQPRSNRMLQATVTTMLLACVCGCADSKFSPWRKKDSELELAKYGPTANQRIEELQKLAKSAEDYLPAQQEQMAQDLAQRFQGETNPLVRAQLVRTLQQFQTESSRGAVMAAMSDSSRLVRVASCQTWGVWGGAEAVQVLGNTVANDLDLDVRLAAIRALGNIPDSAAIAAIGPALEDPDPAMQFLAVESLQEVTRADLGTDVNAWRQYVQSRSPGGQPAASIAERPRGFF